MTELTELVEELAHLGVKLVTEHGRLKVIASKGVLTADLQQRMLENKAGLMRRLEQAQSMGSAQTAVDITSDPQTDRQPFPLSDLQLGFYIANDPYMEYHVRPHIYMEWDCADLDIRAYEAAWNKALRRHARELCIVNSDVEMQILSEAPVIKCIVHDWRHLDAAAVADKLLGVRQEMMRQELPLTSWPWFDLRVSCWSDGNHDRTRIHYNHNSYFIDGFGAALLLNEVDEYYNDAELSYPPAAISFKDAVLTLERLAQSERGQQAQSYWLSRLSSLPPPPGLPQKTGLNRRCRSRLQRREGFLAKDAWDAFKTRASAHGLTPSSGIIAAYAHVIATWSNSDHFILSQMVTRRFSELHPDIMRILGNFASLYPLEIQLCSDACFAENAQAIQSQVLHDMKHLQYGGMRVMQELNRLKGSFGSSPSPFVIGSGLFIRKYRKADFAVLETSQTLLDHQFFELDDGSYYYMWDLLEEFFPEGMVDEMFAAFQGLLRNLADHEEFWRRSDLCLAPQGSARPQSGANVSAAGETTGTLHQALHEQATQRGRHTVLIDAAGEVRYDELDEWSNCVAVQLLSLGVGQGTVVPVVMERTRELAVAVMGILKAGAAYVPIDPNLPAERIAFLLRDVGALVVLTQSRFQQVLDWPEKVTPVVVSTPSSAGSAIAPVPCDLPRPSDLAYVIYTSGSTGKPKGVMIDHRGALNTILDVNRRFDIGPSDRILGVSAFNFDLSVYDLFGAVAAGASLVYPQPKSALDPGHWLDLMIRQQITVWNSVPALMSLLVDVARRRAVSLPLLRWVLLSGDKIPLDLPDAVKSIAPNAKVVSLGGATEASIWSIYFPVDSVDPGWTTIPYGYALDNQFWEVRDRNGRPCPMWVPGELYVGGVGVALGYWNDPEKTQRSFQLDAASGTRLYRTGDLGRYLPGGCIEWLGRADFQVKIQGHRIELGEIEAVLSEHPRIAQAVVTVQDAAESHRPRLVAHVVGVDDKHLDTHELQSFLQKKLPAYMIPAVWHVMPQLPLTANGKIDRKALMQVEHADDARQHVAHQYVAPSNEIEAKLQVIWQAVLRSPRIGVSDDFFDLGGQSFDAIRIFARVKEELGTLCTLSDMWSHRTIAQLGQLIADPTTGASGGLLVPINRKSRGSPLFLVHPAGGSVMAYANLAQRVNRPLYGIQLVGNTVPATDRRDIVTLARRYIGELRSVQAEGPICLGGWSSGAMIAFEMASQLQQVGEKIGRVFILDGPTPVPHEQLSAEQLIVWFVQDLAMNLPVDRLRQASFSGLTSEQQLRKAAQLMGAEKIPEFDVQQLQLAYEIFTDLISAGSSYQPTAIAADLTVIRVEEDVVEEFGAHPHRHDEDWGWSAYTSGRVSCVRVPGNHHNFLSESRVQQWCSLLSPGGLGQGAGESSPVQAMAPLNWCEGRG